MYICIQHMNVHIQLQIDVHTCILLRMQMCASRRVITSMSGQYIYVCIHIYVCLVENGKEILTLDELRFGWVIKISLRGEGGARAQGDQRD